MKKKYFYRSFDSWLKSLCGEKVQKIPLDAHADCPNRDGSIRRGGCTFCNAQGSGSGLMGKGLNLTEQWQFWREKFAKSDRLKNTHLFLAYMQSFSNTYGSAKRLRIITNELQTLPQIAGVSLGTRPDCIDDEKLRILGKLPWDNTWLEYGVQSMHDRTLEKIKRGHNAACSKEAIIKTHEHGIKVCVHLMAGLPNETPEDFLDTLEQVCALPVDGIKMHGLYICKGTELENEYLRGEYKPMEQGIYEELIANALTKIPSHITIHRLCADPGADELVAPAWANQKGHVIRNIEEILHLQNEWQGCKADAAEQNPF